MLDVCPLKGSLVPWLIHFICEEHEKAFEQIKSYSDVQAIEKFLKKVDLLPEDFSKVKK